MIRVCHIITKLELGGAQQNTLYTLAHLDRSRFEPTLITGTEGLLDTEGRASAERSWFIESLDREISVRRDPAALLTLAGLLRKERPHIVHTHSSKAGILGRWAAVLAGVPHIVHSIHGYGFTPRQSRPGRAALIAVERLTGRLTTSAFIAVSEANLKLGLELDLFAADPVSLIRSGVRLADFSPRQPGHQTSTVTVGMVACLKPQKAPLDFVRVAAAVLKQTQVPVRFVLAGDGERRSEVQDLIRRENLERHVTLAGWRRDIPDLMREFDLLLHTSHWEGLPRVFPEAMATGLPIVATRVDGAPEAVHEGVTGHLLEPGDVEGLARRTLELVHDPALRARMGAEARRRTSPWDIDEMVRRQERLYEGLIAGETTRAVALTTQMES